MGYGPLARIKPGICNISDSIVPNPSMAFSVFFNTLQDCYRPIEEVNDTYGVIKIVITFSEVIACKCNSVISLITVIECN